MFEIRSCTATLRLRKQSSGFKALKNVKKSTCRPIRVPVWPEISSTEEVDGCLRVRRRCQVILLFIFGNTVFVSSSD